MAKTITLEMLKAMDLGELDNLFKNALTKRSPEALAVIDLLLQHLSSLGLVVACPTITR